MTIPTVRTAAAVVLTLAFAAAPVLAKERRVTFAVDNMTCASCPFIVKQAMRRVEGVKEVTVSFEKKTATVVFDDARTTPEAIARASTEQGYPAHPLEGDASGTRE